MSVIVNEVRHGFYLDSVGLMRIAQSIRALDGVEEAGLMIGTPANRAIMDEAGLLSADGAAAGPGDLVIAIRARDQSAADRALGKARQAIDAPPSRSSAHSQAWQPHSIRTAKAALGDANLALISVPGDFAAAEAGKALSAGLDVMVFSDNVPLADEIALKRRAASLGRLVMGPDCGTAIIAGVPIGFANVVPRGAIGIVGASGTGMQEISCLIARAGLGISHAIGTGGRDLSREVGGSSTLAAIDLLETDDRTRHIVVVSKPPAAEVAARVIERIGRSSKTFTVCFLGADQVPLPSHARSAVTLADAARLAVAAMGGGARVLAIPPMLAAGRLRGPWIAGLYAGGTLCTEAQIVLRQAGLSVASNVPIPGHEPASARLMGSGHLLLDLGADEFTRGRPHPMIEPAVRDEAMLAALRHAKVGVLLLDVVLGTGGHGDPAGHLARLASGAEGPPVVIASVTGTDADRQGYRRQVEILTRAGILVADSNAAAALMAAEIIAGRAG